jgi:FkbM family methyltransferase
VSLKLGEAGVGVFREKLKRAAKGTPLLNYLLVPIVKVGWRRREAAIKREEYRFRRYCHNLSRLLPNPVFVKVGANDGITGDPCSDILLGNTNWSGLLIEPVPYCFDRLKANFHDSQRFHLEQVAIGESAAHATFYYVDSKALQSVPGLPAWFDQLGSFDRNHIVKHLDGVLDPFILEYEVQVCSLTDVLTRHHIQNVDLLHVDVEGHDYEVLKTLDFGKYRPLAIFIEHKHLSDTHKTEMRDLLRAHGYSIRDCGYDYFATDIKGNKQLRRRRFQRPQGER